MHDIAMSFIQDVIKNKKHQSISSQKETLRQARAIATVKLDDEQKKLDLDILTGRKGWNMMKWIQYCNWLCSAVTYMFGVTQLFGHLWPGLLKCLWLQCCFSKAYDIWHKPRISRLFGKNCQRHGRNGQVLWSWTVAPASLWCCLPRSRSFCTAPTCIN